ncbi:30S ribosomal protein S21 [Loktanella atrilutea]|uniref:30S ribosomal protein S21 n=1 Tax=Loktanella atrilutea TaxID=366533 RepID=UPI0009324923|nr:30S ribosomal protein S21 [Loktanella atrilutea]
MLVSVRDNNVDQALRVLKKKLQGEGVFRAMKLKQHFEKPSVRKAREKAGSIRRHEPRRVCRRPFASLYATISSAARCA